jgi:uncharacterized protein YbjT (DUF2867 family)
MNPGAAPRPRMLLVGGGGGLAGRSLVREFSPDWEIRSVHRYPAPLEPLSHVTWVRGDAAEIADWTPLVDRVDLVVNVAWYRSGPDRRFRPLAAGLRRLIEAARGAGVRRFVHLSVPTATPEIEAGLPYLVRKREVDRALLTSGVPCSVVRPTMLFGPGDKLLTVMLRTAARWHRLPMFGDGAYHVSPLSARDLARIVRHESTLDGVRTVEAGGPRRWAYHELTDRIFAALGRPPSYLRLSPGGGRRLARVLTAVGSTLLYEYEVEWLVSDRLGLPPYAGLATSLESVEEFLHAQAADARRRGPDG